MTKSLAILLALLAVSQAMASDAPIRAVRLTGGVWEELGAGVPSLAEAINDSGLIVGTDYQSGRAFSYSGGVLAEVGYLGTIAGDLPGDSRAHALNSSGQVVGTSAPVYRNAQGGTSYTAPHAFRVTSEVITDLDSTNPAITSHAFGISNGEVVVGGYHGPGMAHETAFRYDGTWTNLGTLGTWSTASAISPNASFIVGISKIGSHDIGSTHLFKYASGTMFDLGSPGGCYLSPIMAVNDAGVIVGSDCYIASPTDVHTRGFYHDGTYHLVPLLSGDTVNRATGISSAGVIVGWGWPSKHPFKFAISGTVLTDLGTAKTGGGNWTRVVPRGINSSGQIVGWAQ